jgi:hypothetical protein
VDHIVAVAKGGSNDDDNLITSCQPCNIGKGATPLSAVPQSLVDKAAETAEREAQVLGYSEIMAARRDRLEGQCWEVVERGWRHPFDEELTFPRSQFQSLKRFVDELGVDECIEAAEIALTKCPHSTYQRFRYFCGICWRKIKRRDGEE